MKKFITYAAYSFLFATFTLLLSNCSKDDEPETPAFTVTYSTVQIQGGLQGLQFTAKCTNNEVKLTKVMITDPLNSTPIEYDFNGTTFTQNEQFNLQATDEAYYKLTGTWKFQFVGTRTSDNTNFAVDASLTVSK